MKIASRLFIPLEVFLAYCLVSWGLSGGVGGGALFRDLALQGRNAEWGLILCGLGMAQAIVSSTEWYFGRRWPDDLLERWVRARCVIAFVGLCVWLYVLFFMATAANRELSFALWLQAPAGMLFSGWAWVENYKVLVLLDPTLSTQNLEKTVIADRRKLLENGR